MNLKFDRISIEVSAEEAHELYYSLRSRLQRTIETHWVNYPDSFERNEQQALHCLEVLNRVVGYSQNVRAEMADYLAGELKKKANAQ